MRVADRFAGAFLVVSLLAAGAAWWWSGGGPGGGRPRRRDPLPAHPGCAGGRRGRRVERSPPGVIVKSGAALERLAPRTLLFDKTGTITARQPTVVEVIPLGSLPADDVLRLAASLDHCAPRAGRVDRQGGAPELRCRCRCRSTSSRYPAAACEERSTSTRWLSGRPAGWSRVRPVGPGRPAAERTSTARSPCSCRSTAHPRRDPPRGSDPGGRRSGAPSAPRAGISRTVMVTGDRPDVAEGIGAVIGADAVLADPRPRTRSTTSERSRPGCSGHGRRRHRRRPSAGLRPTSAWPSAPGGDGHLGGGRHGADR